MSFGLYSGTSEGVNHLFEGYGDYAKEVIVNRAIPDCRDGLKPVHRRSVYGMHLNKIRTLTKSQSVAGAVAEIHPHNSDQIYEAMVLLTNRNGSSNTPLFKAQGNLGKVYRDDPPAAPRYTEIALGPLSDTFLQDLDGVKMKPGEVDADRLEPEFLPARFPAVLTLGGDGIAVGAATKIPPFNLHEVLDLTKKFVRGENIDDEVLVPDFPMGGFVVRDAVEARKMLMAGRGRVISRARVSLEGRQIIVTELPYGKKTTSLVKRIADLELQGVTQVSDQTGRSGVRLVITCRSKKVTEGVLFELYKRGVLQTTFSANMLTMVNDKPIIGGIKRILNEWLKARKQVLSRKFATELKAAEEELKFLDYFIQLISNPQWRDTYLEILVHKSDIDAGNYLNSIFPGIPTPARSWISDRRARAFRDGGRYQNRWNSLTSYVKELNGWLGDLDSYVVKDLEELQHEFRGQYLRKSEITNKDYKFTQVDTSEQAFDNSPVTFLITPSMHIKKVRPGTTAGSGAFEIPGFSDSRLIGFDTQGRVLRVYGEDLPLSTDPTAVGTYLPKYWDIEDGVELAYLGILDGRRRTLVYTDGYVSHFDTKAFFDQKRKTKILQGGVPARVDSRLLEVFTEANVPEVLILGSHADSGGFDIGVINLAQLQPIESNTRRVKVLDPKKGASTVEMSYWGGASQLGSYQLFSSSIGGINAFTGRVKACKESQMNFDPYAAFNEGEFATTSF